MKLDIKKIMALLMTVAMVAATVTFTAGNTLKAEDIQQSSDQAAPAASKEKQQNDNKPVEEKQELTVSADSRESTLGNGNSGQNKGNSNSNSNSNGQKEDNKNGVFIHLGEAVPQQSTVTIKGAAFAVQGSKLSSSTDVEFEQGDVVNVYSGEELIGTLTIKEHGKAETGGKGNYWAEFKIKADAEPPSEQFSISVSAESIEGEYSGSPYSTAAKPSVSEGTTVYYSIDGGETWTTEAPARTNAGTVNVKVKAENSRSENKTAYCEYTIKVTPKPVTVRAKAVKDIVYGETMPSNFEAVVEGTIGSDSVSYAVTCGPAGNGVGTYTVTPAGDAIQDNYYVTYTGTTFRVLPSDTMAISAAGYTGAYDGNYHRGSVSVTVPEGTAVYYSTDNCETWTQEAPSIKNAGEVSVIAKAVNPNYETVTARYTLKVTPGNVTVTAPSYALSYGEDIPAVDTMRATVSGTIEGESVAYSIKCNANAGIGEYPIEFDNPQTSQGNYKVTFVPGKLTIGPAGAVTVTSTDYEGIYDGKGHSGTAVSTEGAQLEYSTDGGNTWTANQPVFANAGEYSYLVRGSKDGYTSSQEITVTVKINKKALVITSGSAEREYNKQPLTNSEVTVSGLIEGEYITLMATGSQTEIGTTDNTVQYAFGTVEGHMGTPAREGNYYIKEINPGTLKVTPVSSPEEPGKVEEGSGSGSGNGGSGGSGGTIEPGAEVTPDEDNGGGDNGGSGNAVIATGITPAGGATGGTGGTAAAAAINADNGVELAQIAAEKTPLANNLLDSNCCILHLLIILAALIMLLWYMHDMRKRQKRIFQLEEELL